MTKKELEEQVKALRAKLDEAHKELDGLKETKSKQGLLDEIGVGGFYDQETRNWVLAELSFNRDTGEAKVTNQRIVGGDVAMFQYRVNEFLATEVHLKNLRS